MKTCSHQTRAGAWLEAANILYTEQARVYNLILEIEQPGLATPASRAIEARVDAFLQQHDCQSIHTVAETIFPASEYRSGGIAKVYAYPDTIFPIIKSLPANRKGTYALRLVQRRCSDGSLFNPLEYALDKLKRQLKQAGPQRAIYELDLNVEALELKLYDVEVDHANPRGGQCLSHISLKLGPNRDLYLTAMYRYQYFVQKALGNLKGLARLQECIARELGIAAGPLVCHATLAILENNEVGEAWKKSAVRTLLEECESVGSPTGNAAQAA